MDLSLLIACVLRFQILNQERESWPFTRFAYLKYACSNNLYRAFPQLSRYRSVFKDSIWTNYQLFLFQPSYSFIPNAHISSMTPRNISWQFLEFMKGHSIILKALLRKGRVFSLVCTENWSWPARAVHRGTVDLKYHKQDSMPIPVHRCDRIRQLVGLDYRKEDLGSRRTRYSDGLQLWYSCRTAHFRNSLLDRHSCLLCRHRHRQTRQSNLDHMGSARSHLWYQWRYHRGQKR